MTPVRRRDLLVIAAAVALVAWLLVRRSYGDLPSLSWWQPLPLGLLAVAEAVGARTLGQRFADRRRSRTEPARRPASPVRPVDPLLAARLVVLAQASAYVGAVFVGVWAGVLLHTLPALGRLTAARGDSVAGVLGVLLAAALTAAALWLEHVCKVPPDDDGTGPGSGVRA